MRVKLAVSLLHMPDTSMSTTTTPHLLFCRALGSLELVMTIPTWHQLPAVWGFLRRLASLSCFALHTPLTLLLSLSFFFQARGHPSPWQVVAGGVFFGYPASSFWGFLRRLASLSCFALHTPLTPLLSFSFFSSTQASFTLAGGSRWCFFWGGTLPPLFGASYAGLLRFLASLCTPFFSSTRASFTLAGGSGWCFFLGYPASSFWGFLRRLASLSCFALHSLFFKHAGILHLGRW